MNTTKLLEMTNKAINMLNKESEEAAAVNYMRDNKLNEISDKNYLYNAGAILEMIRCMCIDDIQAAEAKSAGKGKFLTAIKKFQRECNKQEHKPALKYAHIMPDGRYMLTNAFMALITESDAGLNVAESGKFDVTGMINNIKNSDNNIYEKTEEIPEIAKYAAWLKNAKTNARKGDRIIYHGQGISFNAEMLEAAMRMTGSNTIQYISYCRCAKIEGNGQTVIIMPVKREEGTKPTEIE